VQVFNVSSYNKGIDNAVKSSVKIDCSVDGDFFSKGSGNYLKTNKYKFVLTAAHVVSHCDEIHLANRLGSVVLADIVYQDKERDVAIVKPRNELSETVPVRFNLRKKDYTLGEKVYFMGHPDELNFFLFEGLIALDGTNDFFLHSTGWGGVSGAAIFSKQGEVLGIAKAVKVTVNPITGLPRLLEDLVLVSKSDFLTKETLRDSMGDE
jgi:S1-C subfamily serine protease